MQLVCLTLSDIAYKLKGGLRFKHLTLSTAMSHVVASDNRQLSKANKILPTRDLCNDPNNEQK